MFKRGGIFWEGGVHSERVAYISKMLKRGVYLRWRGRFWEGHIYIKMFKRVVYSEREG